LLLLGRGGGGGGVKEGVPKIIKQIFIKVENLSFGPHY